MLKINPPHLDLCLRVFLIFNCLLYGATLDYNPYANRQQRHLLQTTNSANDGYNAPQSAFNEQQNLQGNSNNQQLYGYFYTPPYQQQQLPLQPQQWSGPPIVVEDEIQQQQQQSVTSIPPTFYPQQAQQQHSTNNFRSSSDLLPFLHRNSKVLAPTVYNTQPTTPRTTQAYFYHNNNNIIYHRDLRHQINTMPELQHTQQEDNNMISWNSQQPQQQNQLLEQQLLPQQKQPPDFYTSDTNLRYNGILNGLPVASFRKVSAPDYGEHFKHYLQTNPRRIKPIYEYIPIK